MVSPMAGMWSSRGQLRKRGTQKPESYVRLSGFIIRQISRIRQKADWSNSLIFSKFLEYVNSRIGHLIDFQRLSSNENRPLICAYR